MLCFCQLLGGVVDAKTPASLAQLSDIVKRTDGEREDGEGGDIMHNNQLFKCFQSSLVFQ